MVLAIGIVIGVVLADGGDGETDVVSTGSEPTSPPTGPITTTTGARDGPAGPPTPAGQALIDLIASGQSLTYTARYQTVDPTNQLGTLLVDVWRAGARIRQDAVVQVEGRTVESSAFIEGEEVRACQRGNGQDWQCEEVPRESAPDVDGRIRDAVSQLSGQTSGGTNTTIAGQPARCFQVIDYDGTEMNLCVTSLGVPARLVAGEASLELVAFEEGVPEGIFTPPA